jgi:hypothetical protein
MQERLYIEEESSSMSLILSQISDRDYAATEDLLQTFAGFIKMYGNYLDFSGDVTASEEEAFLSVYEGVISSVDAATNRMRTILRKLSLEA